MVLLSSRGRGNEDEEVMKQGQREEEEDRREEEMAAAARLDHLEGRHSEEPLANDGNTTVEAYKQRKSERDAKVASDAVVVMVVGKEDESVQQSIELAKTTLASSYYSNLPLSDINGTETGHAHSNSIHSSVHTERASHEDIEFLSLPVFSAVYRTGTVLLPLHGRILVLRPPVSEEEDEDEVDAINGSSASSSSSKEAPASLAAVLVSCIGISRAVRDGLATFSDLVAIHRVSIEQRDILAVTKADLWDKTSALESITRRKVDLEQRLIRSRERVATLKYQSIQNLRYEHSLANMSELLRGFNRASTNLSSGVLGLWSQSSKVLMSPMASHVTLRDAGCVLLILIDVTRIERGKRTVPCSYPRILLSRLRWQ